MLPFFYFIFMTEKELVQIAKSYYEKATSTALVGAVYYYLPFLKMPPFNFVTEKILTAIVQKSSDELEAIAYFERTNLLVDKEGRDFVNAKLGYKNAKTDEEKKKYENEIVATLSKLVSFRE